MSDRETSPSDRSDASRTDVLVVLPTYNEIENLESIVRRIRLAVPDAHVLVVDDASPDGTGDLADRMSAADPAVTVLHRAEKTGLGGAYVAGFGRAIKAGYRFVCEIDADGSHDPDALAPMVRIARERADLVIGSRWIRGGGAVDWPLTRRMISRGGNVYSRMVLGSDIRDLTSGFRVLRTSALADLDLSTVASDGYCFQVELGWRIERAGGTVVEYPITFVDRDRGDSKMGAGIVLEALARVTGWGIDRVRGRTTTKRPPR